MVSYKSGTSNSSVYWVSSRYYYYVKSTNYRWSGRTIQTEGILSSMNLYMCAGCMNYLGTYSIRPIVRLKSDLVYSGSGTSSDPWTISN